MSFLPLEQCNPQRLQGSLGRLHWEAQNPAIRGFPGFPFCLSDLGPLGPKSRRAKLEEQKMLAFGRGFFVRCAGPRAARPLEPPGAPCTARLTAPPATLPGPRRGAGVPGEERPRHPAGRLGSLRSRQGAVSSPCGAAGRTNPLTRPPLEKRARGPRRGLRGTVGGMGVKARAATPQRLGLDAQERPQRLAGGWGCSSPAACHVANAPGGPPEALLICLLRAVSRNT